MDCHEGAVGVTDKKVRIAPCPALAALDPLARDPSHGVELDQLFPVDLSIFRKLIHAFHFPSSLLRRK